MRRIGDHLGSFLFLAILLLVARNLWSAADWPRYGHDAALTGRSPACGSIREPHVSWTFDLSGRELLLELRAAPGQHRLTLPTPAEAEPKSPSLTPFGQKQLDVDGSGTLKSIRETFHERWAKILPEVPGMQRVAWNHTWTDQQVCRLQLFAYDQGLDQPRRIWETDPPEGVVFNPLNVVFDIDGDGVQEVCVAAYYRIMIFEGTTGRKETELRYHSGRPYGWFGLADVDADEQHELVTIGDFQSHIDVLEFDPGRSEAERLSVKWRRDIEQNIDERKKWPQVGPRPLVDVTGDGRPEIALNLFNDTGDGQWHVVVLDAATGKVVCDLARRFVQGAGDVDADGTAELFVAEANGVLVKTCGKIELFDLDNGTPAVRWSREDAGWCTADLPCMGPTWSTTASQGMRHVLLTPGQRPAFLVKTWQNHDQRSVSLSALQFQEGIKLETLWELRGLPDDLAVIPLEPTKEEPPSSALVRIHIAANIRCMLAGDKVQARVVEDRALGIDVSMPIAAFLGTGETMSVIVEGPGQQVFAIAPPCEPTAQPHLLWQRPGRGMRDGSRNAGLLAADLSGNGSSEVLVADRAREGHAQLVAYHGDGTEYWRKDFAQTPGAVPVWNVGALTFWWAGHFRKPATLDVFVNTRRGLMHSDMGQVIDGRDAATIWKRDKAVLPGEFHWGWAGVPLATVDVDGDQRDELISLYPVCFWIANGHDGQIRSGKDLASRSSLPAWAAYGEPMVYDFNEDNLPEVLLDSPYQLALLDTSGKPLWHGPGRDDYPVTTGEGNVGETTRCKHALVDFEGDGQFEIASAGYGNGVRAMDPKTGTVLWSLEAPEPTGPRAVAANIDGQGGDEIIYPSGNTLVVVTGDRSAGRLLWTWTGPTQLSVPAIADVDGDGLVEIIVQDTSATIHCLDGL